MPNLAVRTMVSLVLVVASLLLVACDDGGPTRPTSVRPPPPTPPAPTVEVRPVDARFNDQFWRQFVFDGYEAPSGVSSAQSWMLPHGGQPSMNLYIKTTDPDGRVVSLAAGCSR